MSLPLAVMLGLAPWLLLALLLALGIREPRGLPPAASASSSLPGARDRGSVEPPFVSIVVPARNEAGNIEACVESLAAQAYPAFEIIVVDDRSEDGTGERARVVAPGNARELRVIAGEPLPSGWFGKPWACAQGANAARGDLLLFTDADTRHGPELLARALAGLQEDGAGALSALGRQEMLGFWERVVQPHVFVLLGLRYRRLDRPIDAGRERDAILSGQHILVQRSVYEGIGGHAAVRGEVVEDLRLGQELVRAGHRIVLREAGEDLSTRMYDSLGEMMEGWTKNLAIGARQSAGRWGAAAIPGMVVFLLVAWVLPAVVFAIAGVDALAGVWGFGDRGSAAAGSGVGLGRIGDGAGTGLLAWAVAAVSVNVLLWAGAYRRFGAPMRYAILHPLGGALVAFLAARSFVRGEGRIEWKGRTYSAGSGGRR